MAAVKPLARSIESFLILLATFLIHRLITYPLLFGTIELGTMEGAKAFLVGVLSDVWVAYLLAAVIGGAYALVAVFSGQNAARLTMVSLLCLVGAGAAAHVAYIEFFHFQIVPFHLRYLFDPDFVAANGASLFTWKAAAAFGGFLSAGFLMLWLDLFIEPRAKSMVIGSVALSAVALVAHNRNIHYRVQWFVPENLQVNGFERLYLHTKSSRLPKPLGLEELKALAEATGSLPSEVKDVETPTLFQVLTRPVPPPGGYEDPAPKIRDAFQALVASGQKPLALVLLLESLRPSETGYFAPGTASLTPRLDALAASGVAFRRAYSTGSVTRGAQEATFCGYRGARDSSVMRGLVVARIACLGDRAKHKAETFWYHGGDGRFDGQRDFWADHGMNDRMAIDAFPAEAPRTGWGIGDRTFLQTAASKIQALAQRTTRPYLLGMVLSVSNHIPWDLPGDAAPELGGKTFAHPSYRTTAYADDAVGRFVDELKAAGLWQKALLVIASDHGNSLPPLNDLYESDPKRDDLLASHVNLIVSGGIAESVATQHLADEPVSQADVAPFLAFVTGIEGARFFADGLFSRRRELPLYADLEQGVFLPDGASTAETTALYRRALFQYMSIWSDAL